jgi:hypothetical protein
VEMWYPKAVVAPGPSWKVWPEINKVQGIINHSMDGWYWYAYGHIIQGATQLSWHFSIKKSGTVVQHYPLGASCWHAGSRRLNGLFIGVEHEGLASDPLTEEQIVSSVELNRWIAEQGQFTMTRDNPRNLWEHGELSNTACPSGRIPWARYTYTPPVAPELLNNFVGTRRTGDGAWEYEYATTVWHPNMDNAIGPYFAVDAATYHGLVDGKHKYTYKLRVYPNWQG